MIMQIETTGGKELLEALISSSVIGLVLYQGDGKIVLANKIFCDFIGYSESELRTMYPYDLVPDEYKASVKDLMKRRIGGEVFVAEQMSHAHKTKAGLLIPTIVFACTINYGGKPAGLALVLDISKQKAFEKRFVALGEINRLIIMDKNINIRLLNEAIEQSSEWFVMADERGTIIHANKAVENISGYKINEIIGKNLRIFKSGLHNKEFYATLRRTIFKGKIFRSVITNRDKRGSLFYLDTVIVPVKIDGKSLRFVDISRDITNEIKQQKKIESTSLLYATLSEINQLIVRAKNEADLLLDVCNKIVNRGLFKYAWIGIFDKNKELKRTFACDKSDYINYVKNALTRPNAKQGPSLSSFLKSKIVINNDTSRNSVMAPWKDELLRRGYLSSASIPVIKKGKTIGSLNFYSEKQGIFDKDTYKLLKEIMIDLHYALDKIEDEKWSAMVSKALNSGSDFVIITDKYFKLLYLNESAYKIFGYSTEELRGKYYRTFFLGGVGKSDFAKKFKDTLLSDKILTDMFTYRTRDGQIIYGYTDIIPFKVGKYTEYYIVVGKDMTQELIAEETMYKLFYFDILTGLPNRKFIRDKMEAFFQGDKDERLVCALTIINPVNFSLINQTLGFEIGNKIMVKIFERIKKQVKDYDIIAKLEADKFAVFLKNLRYKEDALVIVDKILEFLGDTYVINDKRVDISFNAGISFYPKDAQIPRDILSKAEAALLNVRSKGESGVGCFKKEFEEYARKKIELRNSLKEAIKKKEFILHYQPCFDTQTGIMRGAEALLRWKRRGEIIPPMEFIPFLEQSGMITEVENWIIDEVASKIRTWLDRGLMVVPISMNISSASFKSKYLEENIVKALKKYNIAPKFFALEMVERTFIEDSEYSNKLLNSLKKIGIQLLIDDFGTGYSSLSYLADFPFDDLKIDISFVRKMLADKHSRYITEAVVYLAQKLNIKSIAEGVETEEQLSFLKNIGCDCIQGFLLSKPLKDESFAKLLLKNTPLPKFMSKEP